MLWLALHGYVVLGNEKRTAPGLSAFGPYMKAAQRPGRRKARKRARPSPWPLLATLFDSAWFWYRAMTTPGNVVVVQTYDHTCADADLLVSEGLLLDEWGSIKASSFEVSLPSWSRPKEALRFCCPAAQPPVINTGDLVLADVPKITQRSADKARFPLTHKGMYYFVRLSGRWDEGGGQFVLLEHPLTAPMPDVDFDDGTVDLAKVTCHPDTVRSPAATAAPSGVRITLTPTRGYGEMRMQWVAVKTPSKWSACVWGASPPPNRRVSRTLPAAAGPKSVTSLWRQSHHHLDMRRRTDIATPLRACLLDARNERGPSAEVAMLLSTGVAAAIGHGAIRLVIAMLYPATHVHIVFHNQFNLPMSGWDLVNAGSQCAKTDVLFALAKTVQAWFPHCATCRSGLPKGAPPHSWQDAPPDAEFTTTTVPTIQYMVKVDLLRDRSAASNQPWAPPKPAKYDVDYEDKSQWKCAHPTCDFVGSFDEVVEHEEACDRVKNVEQEDGSLPQAQQLLLPPPTDGYDAQGDRAVRAAELALKRRTTEEGGGWGGREPKKSRRRTPASALAMRRTAF